MPRQLQLDEATAYAIAYLTERGYVLDRDFTINTAATLAAEIIWARGFGPRRAQ
jgi:hypothetical protein